MTHPDPDIPSHVLPDGTLSAEIQAHADWLRRLAARLVADEHEVDDVVQEVWQAALTNPPARGSSWGRWLRGVLHNVVSSRRRGRTRMRAREAAVATKEGTPSTASLVQRTEVQRTLSRALFDLAPIYRDVLLLRFYDGLPPREIAARLDVPVNTVRTRQARGLDILREKLDQTHKSRERWTAALAPWLVPTRDGAVVPSSLAISPLLLWGGLFAGFALCVVVAVGGGVLSMGRGDGKPQEGASSAHSPSATSDGELGEKRQSLLPRGAEDERGDGESPRHTSTWLDGRVIDARSALPLERAQVWGVTEDGSRLGSVERTDGRGSFELRGVPGNRIVVEHEGYFSKSVSREDVREGVISLEPQAVFSVRVLDATERPVPYASLFFYGLDEADSELKRFTDLEGQHRFEALREGRYHLFVVAGSGSGDEKVYAHGRWVLRPGETREVELTLDELETPSREGVIYRRYPEDPALVPVFFPEHMGEGFIQTHPDGMGGYRAGPLEPGRHFVLLIPADNLRFDQATCSMIPQIEIDENHGRRLDFEVPSGFVRGRLELRGEDEGQVSIIAFPQEAGEDVREFLSIPVNRQIFTMTPGRDGSFEVGPLVNGSYQLECRSEGESISTKTVEVRGATNIGTWFIAQ